MGRWNPKQKDRLYTVLTHVSWVAVATYGIFYANFDRAEVNGRPLPEHMRQDHIFTGVRRWAREQYTMFVTPPSHKRGKGEEEDEGCETSQVSGSVSQGTTIPQALAEQEGAKAPSS